MKTSLEEISPIKKRLLIEIDSREVDEKLDRAYQEVGKKAKIPGFRPGKIPMKILERYFATQVTEDVSNGIISDTFQQAMEEVKTFPVATPLLEKEPLKRGQNFKYSAVMEIRPRFELKDYLGIEVEKEKWTVTDQDVNEEIQKILQSHGKLSPVDGERPIQKDDYVLVEYQAYEGEIPLPEIQSKNFLLRVGSNDFHPKFEDALIGLTKGAETEINVDFEGDYFHKKLAGKKVRFKVKVMEIKKMILPELTDEFAASLGGELKNLEELREKVRESIGEREKRRTEKEAKQKLLRKVSESVDFELPQALVEAEIDYAIENIRQNLARSGSNLEKTGLSPQKLREEFRLAAETRVKHMFVLGQIADQNHISVDEADLEEAYKDMASSTGEDSATLRKYYESRGLVDSLKQRLLEEKTLNYLLGRAKILKVESPSEKRDT